MVPKTNWATGELHRQGHAVQTFRDVDAEFRKYAQVTGKTLDPLGPKPQRPQLSDFYVRCDDQKDN